MCMNSKAHQCQMDLCTFNVKYFSYGKIKKYVSDTFHSAHGNYKLQDIQFATGMQKLD